MLTKLRVGLAGFGVVGERRYRVLCEHPNFEVIAIADKKLVDGYPVDSHIKTFQEFEELGSVKLDVLFVSLPNDDAPTATIMGLQNGWHVFCEKPPGRSVRDVRKVAAASAVRPDLKLKYGFGHRYHDSVKEALRIIRSAELGKVVNLRGLWKIGVYPWPSHPRSAQLLWVKILANEQRHCGRWNSIDPNSHG